MFELGRFRRMPPGAPYPPAVGPRGGAPVKARFYLVGERYGAAALTRADDGLVASAALELANNVGVIVQWCRVGEGRDDVWHTVTPRRTLIVHRDAPAFIPRPHA